MSFLLRILAVSSAAMLFLPVACGQGWFELNNRVGTEIDARFVLPTDAPGTSSVGTNFQIQLFGGPEGGTLSPIVPFWPPSTGFRESAGSALAGYVVGISGQVPGANIGSSATILVQVFGGPSWDTATYRFERDYTVLLGDWDTPGWVPLGTSPLVLHAIPEPSLPVLALTGLAGLMVARRGVHRAEEGRCRQRRGIALVACRTCRARRA